MSNKYGFDDVIDAQRGIFGSAEASISGSSAMNDWSTPKSTPTEAGLAVDLQCEACGTPRRVTMEYPELIAIKYGLQPQAILPRLNIQCSQWGYDPSNRMWYPDARCSCGMALRPMITVGEGDAALRIAQAQKWLKPEFVNQLSNVCDQARGGR